MYPMGSGVWCQEHFRIFFTIPGTGSTWGAGTSRVHASERPARPRTACSIGGRRSQGQGRRSRGSPARGLPQSRRCKRRGCRCRWSWGGFYGVESVVSREETERFYSYSQWRDSSGSPYGHHAEGSSEPSEYGLSSRSSGALWQVVQRPMGRPGLRCHSNGITGASAPQHSQTPGRYWSGSGLGVEVVMGLHGKGWAVCCQ